MQTTTCCVTGDLLSIHPSVITVCPMVREQVIHATVKDRLVMPHWFNDLGALIPR